MRVRQVPPIEFEVEIRLSSREARQLILEVSQMEGLCAPLVWALRRALRELGE